MRSLVLLALGLFLTACGNAPIPNAPHSTPTQTTESDSSKVLNIRNSFGAIENTAFRLVLEEQMKPAVVEGDQVYVTSISSGEKSVVVGYNYAGEKMKGAIQSFKISDSKAELVSEIHFPAADVNAVAADKDYSYFAGVDGDGAYLSRVKMKDIEFSDSVERVSVPSFAATDILVDDYVFVSSGDKGGGVSAFEKESLKEVAFFEAYDARALSRKNDQLFVLSGQPGIFWDLSIKYFVKGEDPVNGKQELSGASIAESKGSLVSNQKYSVASVGELGFQIIHNENLRILAEQKPAKGAITNSVAIYKSWIFAANGDAGIWVYQYRGNSLRELGYIELSTSSVNHIVYDHDRLFVGTGEGLKIIQIED